jgi:hypothetical protein
MFPPFFRHPGVHRHAWRMCRGFRNRWKGAHLILFTVSASQSHHRTYSGLSLDEYRKMCEYCYRDPGITGLVSAGDRVVVMDGMGIDTGIDVDLFLETGSMVERIVGRRLRSECVHAGRIPQSLTGR